MSLSLPRPIEILSKCRSILCGVAQPCDLHTRSRRTRTHIELFRWRFGACGGRASSVWWRGPSRWSGRCRAAELFFRLSAPAGATALERSSLIDRCCPALSSSFGRCGDSAHIAGLALTCSKKSNAWALRDAIVRRQGHGIKRAAGKIVAARLAVGAKIQIGLWAASRGFQR